MRHVRMLGLCLVALFALGAVVAGSALAKKNKEETSQQIFERLFAECPIGYSEIPAGEEFASCMNGEAGKESFFQAGNVTVHFKKPVVLRAGILENEETGLWSIIPSRYGNTISKEAEPAPSLTEGLNAERLEGPEKTRYEEYLANGGSTKVTATIELAAPATEITANAAAILNEEPEGAFAPAFSFPVEIHLNNKFLGTHCYDGSYVEPIVVRFITGETNPPAPNKPIHGSKGTIHGVDEGKILLLEHAKLVNNTYAAPGVNGCGVNGGADAAVDAGLGLPSPAGSNTTELIGNLQNAGHRLVEEELQGF